ncbi:MAG TPA: hypothetical protein VL173_13205 [Vicinamibacterales bacterium]|jgi:hypothetical protein|nr:hypothetical protein [Vicinamibacterales bacterium]
MQRLLVLALVLGVTATATARTQTPRRPAATASADVVLTGELENWIAADGETTGWRLRTRTEDGKRHYVEVLLTAEIAQGVRSHVPVQVRGVMQRRHYVERGDVQVLVAKAVIEVPRQRR